MNRSMIQAHNLFKSFQNKNVLNGLSLTINKGDTIAIIGSSGCGKSVFLKHIVGLLAPDSGYVKVEGKIIHEMSNIELYELRQKFGFLFQFASIFDSMTVSENIILPLIEKGYKLSDKEIDQIVNDKLNLVKLHGIKEMKPSELSGGMKKRVGLARALVTNPEYIFYDEPTTGLDPITSDSIDDLIKDLSDKLKVTSIIVTHDLFTVKNTANRIVMLHEGRVYFDGSYNDLINSKDKVVINFINRTGIANG